LTAHEHIPVPAHLLDQEPELLPDWTGPGPEPGPRAGRRIRAGLRHSRWQARIDAYRATHRDRAIRCTTAHDTEETE
jgi:hypothetical protein